MPDPEGQAPIDIERQAQPAGAGYISPVKRQLYLEGLENFQ